MVGSADANLLLAAVDPQDALHARARSHIHAHGRLRASVPAVLEAFIVLRRRGASLQALVARLNEHFDLDDAGSLQTAAWALDKGLLRTPFDAYHAADAHRRGEPLHTADQELLASAFPTIAY